MNETTPLLSLTDLAQRLHISKRKLEQMIAGGEVPPPLRFGRVRRWHPAIIERYLAQLAGLMDPDPSPDPEPRSRPRGRPRGK